MSFLENIIRFLTIDEDKYQDKIIKFINNFELFIEGFQKLPELVQISAKKWAEYGWVPCIPGYTGIDLLKADFYPNTQKDADNRILSILYKEDNLKTLFKEINESIKLHNFNVITYGEAESCFKNEEYVACSLLLFALIDEVFTKEQPKVNKKTRLLSNRAVDEVFDSNQVQYIVNGITVQLIIKKIFAHADDFDYDKEKGLNRNFISHGMNNYIPDKTDCIKLYVLLYNIYMLFDSKIYKWNNCPKK